MKGGTRGRSYPLLETPQQRPSSKKVEEIEGLSARERSVVADDIDHEIKQFQPYHDKNVLGSVM